ncbi:PREDICTED: uncharacterized protein LOC104803312 [Tarenaya hassleriana]|uniref:uncharacterized protein LOC104803312 n=1 Tax=Tarenaya hassleriana TaxID=28532 RepID=UPI00053C91EC|nr:PREDICTED: uncharacterized protein LOC104803312 [Tarenaya hassleriana]
MVKLQEVPKVVGTADVQGHYDQPYYGGYAFTEMAQDMKSILASNFPDDKEARPQAVLFKSLWLEAEAALYSTTCMAHFYRIRNEIDDHKLLNKENSANASSSWQERSFNLQKSIPITKNPGPHTTKSVVDENSVITMNCVTGSSGHNTDSAGAKLKPDANYGKVPSAIPEDALISNTNSYADDVTDRFQILKRGEAKHENRLDSHSNSDSDKAVRSTNRRRPEERPNVTDTTLFVRNIRSLLMHAYTIFHFTVQRQWLIRITEH